MKLLRIIFFSNSRLLKESPRFSVRPSAKPCSVGPHHNFTHSIANPKAVFQADIFKRSSHNMTDKEDLKKKLTPLQYHVTQEKGTERPYTGEYDKFFEEGMYSCVVCGQDLFSSKTKFDSGCGWPAFNDVLDQGLVKLSTDTSLGMIRTEVQCAKCNAHMGHVFEDGPKPTRKRFCINSASIKFTPAKSQ